MAIYLIIGRPGGGKSYTAVKEHVVPLMKEGRPIITNLPLLTDHIKAVHGQSSVDKITLVDDGKTYQATGAFGEDVDRYHFYKKEHYLVNGEEKNEEGHGPVVIIDECSKVLDKSVADEDLLKFYAYHRHYGLDIYLIAQTTKQIHPKILDMAQLTYSVTKASALKGPNHYVYKVIDGHNGEAVDSQIKEYKSEYFKYYKSHTQSSSPVNEANAKGVKPMMGGLLFKMKTALFIFAGFMALYTIYLFISDDDDKQLTDQSQSQPAHKPEQVEQNTKYKASKISKPSPLPKSKSPVKHAYSEGVYDEVGHPYEGYIMVIEGWSEYTMNSQRRKNHYIGLYKDEVLISTFDLYDLTLSGYRYNVYHKCLIRIRYQRFQTHLVCKQPQPNDGENETNTNDSDRTETNV